MGKKYIIATIMIALFLTACKGENDISDGQSGPTNCNDDTEKIYDMIGGKWIAQNGIKTSNELVNKYFPGLDGLVMTFWEYESLGDDNSSAVGPSDYCYKGYIVLEAGKVSQLFDEYSWEETDFSPSSENIDMSDYDEDTWYYSEEFQEQVMKKTVAGKIYGNGEILWFEFTTM